MEGANRKPGRSAMLLLVTCWCMASFVGTQASAIPCALGGDLLPYFSCKKIAFFKTHKTGGTTLRSILLRLALTRNMVVHMTPPNDPFIRVDGGLAGPVATADMVTDHIRPLHNRMWHMLARGFYARTLGVYEYGFLTMLRHPVDRYVSHFYFWYEPEMRARGAPMTLAQFVAEGRDANQVSRSMSLHTLDDVLALTSGEAFASGLYLPVELLDYGLGLMAVRCGWGASQLLYMPLNAHAGGKLSRFNVTRLQRPTLAELAASDPALYRAVASSNFLDLALYAAARGAVARALEAAPPAVYSAATRVLDLRLRVRARCRQLRPGAANATIASVSDGAGNGTQTASAALGMPWSPMDVEDEYAICRWFSTTPPRQRSKAEPKLRAAQLASQALRALDEQQYWHSVVGVAVRACDARADGAGALAAWAAHHALQGVQHLVLHVARAEDVGSVNATIANALQSCGPDCAFTSFEVLPADVPGADAAAWRHMRYARWCAHLESPRELMRGVQGPLRAELLAVEGGSPAAGQQLCAPVLACNTTAPAAAAGARYPRDGPCVGVVPELVGAAKCVHVRPLPSLSMDPDLGLPLLSVRDAAVKGNYSAVTGGGPPAIVVVQLAGGAC